MDNYKMEHDYSFKIVITGNSGVGKSCLNYRLSADTFGQVHLSNIGIDFGTRTFVIDGLKVRLQLWDTYGQERFHAVTNSYYRGADGIILAYDITNLKSFQDLEMWLKMISEAETLPNCKLVVGTKCDMTSDRPFQEHLGSYEEQLPHHFQQHTPSSAHRLLQVGDSPPPFQDMRQVYYHSAARFAEEHHLVGAIETSAKESINVELAYVTLAAAILQQKQSTNKTTPDEDVIEENRAENNHWACTTL